MGPPRLRGGASVCPAPTSAPPDLGLPCFEWRPANDRCWTLGKSTDGILPTTSQKASCLTGKLSGVLTPKGHVHRCRPSSIPFQSQMKPWDPVSDTSPLRLGNDELGGSHLPLPERCPPPTQTASSSRAIMGNTVFSGCATAHTGQGQMRRVSAELRLSLSSHDVGPHRESSETGSSRGCRMFRS